MAIIKNKIKKAVFCADDYGISPGVCDAINALLAIGRLTATGAMTLLPGWRSHAAQLKTVVSGASSGADIGVHLTLTDHAPLFNNTAPALAVQGKLPTLKWLLAASYTRSLPAEAVRAEIRAQLDAFEDAWGAPPDFVDGHQHVHLLPGVREPLIEELTKRYNAGSVYVRNCAEPAFSILRRGIGVKKALLLSAMSRRFTRLVYNAGSQNADSPRPSQANSPQNAGLQMNEGFSGIHDFADVDFRPRMQRFLKYLGARPLIHVHPGHVDDELKKRDALTAPREREFAYLSSDAFLEDLGKAGVMPARFSALSS